MKNQGYINLDEWEIDRKLFLKNPRDRVFLEAMTRKMEASPEALKKKIKERAESEAMIVNPWQTFKHIMGNMPRDYTFAYKTESDPWFEV